MDPRGKDGTFPFKYRDSVSTDLRETFRRALEQQAAEAAAPKVRQINPTKTSRNMNDVAVPEAQRMELNSAA
jgi:hypothetical protein